MSSVAPSVRCSSDHILCFYANRGHQPQIARITNIPNWFFERVLYPGQSILFETQPQATLELGGIAPASCHLADRIPCSTLQINPVLVTSLLSRLT